jgi:hypothetical protein
MEPAATVYCEAYGLVADEIIEVYTVAVYGTWLWLATGQSGEKQQ